MIKCKDCGIKVRRGSNRQKQCKSCSKMYRKASQKAYKQLPRVKRLHKVSYRKYIQSPKAMAKYARNQLDKFLKLIGIKNLRDIKMCSDRKLEKIAGGNGYPDFLKETLEEKGPKMDCLGISQWARAILEYRAGRKYRVAWRFTSIRRKIFKDVFDFYNWQQCQST